MKKLINYFKVRLYAQPFDFINEELCENGRNDGYYISLDGIIYYGHPLFFGVKSCANDNYWLKSQRRKTLITALNQTK